MKYDRKSSMYVMVILSQYIEVPTKLEGSGGTKNDPE